MVKYVKTAGGWGVFTQVGRRDHVTLGLSWAEEAFKFSFDRIHLRMLLRVLLFVLKEVRSPGEDLEKLYTSLLPDFLQTPGKAFLEEVVLAKLRGADIEASPQSVAWGWGDEMRRLKEFAEKLRGGGGA